VEAEKTNNFELGVKSALLQRTLIVNADVFLSKIRNYQQTVRVPDAYTTANQDPSLPAAYANITGNVPKVKLYGLELDAVYGGLRNTTIRVAGAYNRAVYVSFPNAGYPAESANQQTATNPYRDASGETLPGAPKLSFNVGVDWRHPVWGDKEFHVSGNAAYQSSFLSDNTSSAYSRIPGSTIVDAAVGLGKIDKTFDVSLVVKNLFNDDTPLARTWTSVTPAIPRSFGIQIIGKL
jgi:outer membrane receptor protein involved in Fe transport